MFRSDFRSGSGFIFGSTFSLFRNLCPTTLSDLILAPVPFFYAHFSLLSYQIRFPGPGLFSTTPVDPLFDPLRDLYPYSPLYLLRDLGLGSGSAPPFCSAFISEYGSVFSFVLGFA